MRPRRCRGDEGAFLVLWALLLVALFTMIAIVIDLGALRNDRRKDRAAADSAATAAANDIPMGSSAACRTALDFAAINLGKDPASFSTVQTPCGSWSACNPSAASRSVTYTGAGYKITITNPVPNGDPLLTGADAVGGDIPQSGTTSTDGLQCERVGVAIGYTRESIFGRVVGNNSNSTTVHSVARYVASVGTGGEKPALVALEPLNNCSVDAGNGQIRAFNTANQAGLIYADSLGTGSNCSGNGSWVFNGGTPGRIWADPAPSGVAGELGYAAPTFADAFDPQPDYGTSAAGAPQPPANRVKLAAPITRAPVDKVYRCGNVTPVPATCVTFGAGINDYILDLGNRYGNSTTAPAGFTPFPGVAVAGTCADPPVLFPANQNWYINCPDFTVGHPVTFQNRDIVFSGNINIISGGNLIFNALNATAITPAGDDTTVVVRGTNGVTTTSNAWSLNWYRTMVFMDNNTCPAAPATCGRLVIDNGMGNWTAPTEGNLKDLIYWTESTQPHTFQGDPTFSWEGIFFAGRSRFTLSGTVTVDATEVQLWVNSAEIAGSQSSKLLLRPDPNKSISTSRTGSALIR